MSQGFRYCTADAAFIVHTLHHTQQGAAQAVKRNPGLGLDVWKMPQPYALAAGDLVPASGVKVEIHTPPPRARRPRIGE